MTAFLIATQRHSHLQPEYALRSGRTRIGRHPENDIAIMLESVSRFHAELEEQGSFYVLHDCQSRNGTYLNGDRVSEPCPIRQGDRVQFGNVEFIFRLTPLSEPTAASQEDTNVTVLKRGPEHQVLHQRPLEEVPRDFGISTDIGAVEGPLSKRVAALYQITNYLRQNDPEEPDTMKVVLRRLFDEIPAERAALLTIGEGGGMEPVAWLRRRESRQETSPRIAISQTICELAVREKSAILVGDLQTDERFKQSDSVASGQVSSAICVPLVVGEKVFGLLYVDTQRPTLELGVEDVSFAGMAAAELSYAMWSQSEAPGVRTGGDSQAGSTTETLLHTAQALEKVLNQCSNAVPTVTQALAESDVETARSSWKQVKSGVKRLGKVLREMTEYAQPPKPQMTEVDVAQVLRDTLSAFSDELRAAKIDVELDIRDGLGLRRLDEEAVYKALINVVENAYEALVARGGHLKISAYETAQGALIVEIADDGPGVPPQALTRAFQPFNSGPGSRGLGMGLAMTRQLLEAMNGSVTLNSEPNRGTTVTMIFPPGSRV